MPPLTRWFVKTSFVYLALALSAGLLMGMQSALKLTSLAGLFPVYIHLFVLGWLTQLIFGVVFWMFPKYSSEEPRGSESLGWWTYVLINIGLILRVFAEPINSIQPNTLTGWMLVLSAVTQFVAGLLFVINSWGRVKEK
jgi:cbb3-type cytochrome oxidase subunit 1